MKQSAKWPDEMSLVARVEKEKEVGEVEKLEWSSPVWNDC